MTSRSTSIHNLNADSGLNQLQKKFYWLLNWVNNQLPYTNVDNSLVIRDFTCANIRKLWARLVTKSSPARRLSDLFWLKLPWGKIRKEIGVINILDVGCGSGNFGIKLQDYTNNKIASYTGIDLHEHENWAKLEEKYSNFRFYQLKDNNISDYIPEGTNFFMTQSALEHFDEDLIYFEQVRDYILSYKRRIIQVHLFPSSSCLQLYPFHGVRQYTPRTVSKITRLFKDYSYAVLFKLGGNECIRLHYEFIAKPLSQRIGDFRDLKTQEYEKRLFMAIKHDMKYPQKFPNFYALVIHSNWSKKIFNHHLTV